jgi:hypothetical protein
MRWLSCLPMRQDSLKSRLVGIGPHAYRHICASGLSSHIAEYERCLVLRGCLPASRTKA